ncbi:hypothetical protein GH714_003494 [Hevea brasiliensis]|uniref:Bifunctional inhibitor/plant lipid transfer protein/seed storage helical domain-containing protein n=1 Tax=Hevea brasiliensis TaxID=3981 RepID=A0A6A6KZW5_HEVBR|nr:hypothetical protein GH714_003494 [Hevea brasiliensis]
MWRVGPRPFDTHFKAVAEMAVIGFGLSKDAFTFIMKQSNLLASIGEAMKRAAVAPYRSIPPSEACCNAVKSLGQPCLCVLLNGPPISGVDRNMALQLPDKCFANFEPCEITRK